MVQWHLRYSSSVLHHRCDESPSVLAESIVAASSQLVVTNTLFPSMEILVHISSPSTARDDARYRAQVAAILAFQPVSQQRLAADTRDSPHPQASGSESVQASVAPISLSAPDAPGERCVLSSHSDHDDAVPDSALDLHPILRPSANEIALTPSPSPSDRFDHPVHDPDSLESLVSVIPDSQPEIVEPGPSQSASWQPSKRRRIGDSGWPANDHPPSSSASPAKRPEEQHRDKGTSALTPARHSPRILHPHPSSPFPFPLHSLPQEIHPPPPPISTASFTTHITPTLAMLTDRLNPARTYKPLHQSRPLDKLERGYWAVHLNLLRPQTPDEAAPAPAPGSGHGVAGEIARKSDCAQQQQQQRKNAWTASVFARFWAFLSDFIGRDARAGWGVWCIVEDAAGSAARWAGGDDAGGAREVVPVLVKVYAWGEVAMHVYLLLFLASERYIRGVGAQWRDSREEVVIQMA
ncbi:uncharacterized protein N7459_002337 [Penicillium hispanicum]|uniref:uncharacterized protein n=1 Tax=Penicillium hispanicum TaxID=1080232 RepID=UPI002540A46C|nr:uncharacterized protein N7459_002337 [Penicillium hispanicum]KAJ5591968.1 hypothetical protein N7459_002337 [Penicillium hispanicum]